MPYLNLKLAPPVTAETAARLAAQLAELTTSVLGKKKEVTAVAVEQAPATLWFIGARPLMPQRASFFLEVKVTEGTNTKDEKAAFLQAAFKAAQAVLGQVDPASYIVVHEVRADSWGYAGMTQEQRYVESKGLTEGAAGGRTAQLRAL